MAALMREASRCGLVLNRRSNIGLTWCRRNVFFRNKKNLLTGEGNGRLMSSDQASSWTKVDLDKMMEDEERENKNIKVSVNIKQLFGNPESASIKVEKRDNEGAISNVLEQINSRRDNADQRGSNHRPVQRFNSKENNSAKSKDYFSQGKKDLKSTKNSDKVKVVNFSYPKVSIPPECATVPVDKFNFLKFAEDNTTIEFSNAEEVPNSRTIFAEKFDKVTDDLFTEGKFLSQEQWEEAGKYLLENDREEHVRLPPNIAKHWPVRFMLNFSSRVVNADKFDFVKSLWMYALDFYKNKPPPLLMAAYMNILGSLGREDEALEMYDKIKDATKGIPEISIYFHVVASLLGTTKWREIRALTEKMVKLYGSGKAVQDCWFVLAYGHLMHGELEEYEQVMKMLRDEGFDPTDSNVAIQLLIKMEMKSGLKFLENCRENLWLPGKDMANGVLALLQRDSNHSWTVTPTKMDLRGECRNCGERLSKANGLSEGQFATLQSQALDALVDGRDIYLKSNPGERRAFLSFCEDYGPFDAVLDGLNLFYARAQHSKTNIQEVITMIKMKYPHKSNILVVIRRHLMKTFGIRMERGSPSMLFKAHVFPLRNDSEDDPFLLMAALSSGRDCLVVSNDDFSDQSYTFGSGLRPLFLSWQRTNQIFYRKETSSINLQWPKEFEHSVQEHENGIHLPFSVSQSLAAKIRPPNSWLCLAKTPKS